MRWILRPHQMPVVLHLPGPASDAGRTQRSFFHIIGAHVKCGDVGIVGWVAATYIQKLCEDDLLRGRVRLVPPVECLLATPFFALSHNLWKLIDSRLNTLGYH